MTLAEALAAARRRLRAAAIEDADLEAEVLLRHALGFGSDRAALFRRLDEAADPAALASFEAFVARRLAHEPSAYITGRREFYGREFEVGPAVLIPRPETETLVEVAIEIASSSAAPLSHPSEGSHEPQAHPERFQSSEGSHEPQAHPERFQSILDVGTGSGCIAVSLALALPAARVYASDSSAAALAVARRNAARHGVAERIAFIEADLLALDALDLDALGLNAAPLSHPSEGSRESRANPERFHPSEGSREPRANPERFHPSEGSREPQANPERFQSVGLIVANLPYVKTSDWLALPPELRDHEPRAALDGGPDGLAPIRRLLAAAAAHLHPGGALCIEFGDGQAEAVIALARGAFANASISARSDLAGRPRVLVVAGLHGT